jgi:hypothetical protein
VSIFSSLFRLACNLTIFQKITLQRSWILFPAHFFVIGEFFIFILYFLRIFLNLLKNGWLFKGSRVLILSFFAASCYDGRNIWLFLLGHCLVMTLTLRITQRDDSDTVVNEITWTRKFCIALALVFSQVFAFLPFKRKTSTRFHYALYYYAVS